MIKGIHHVAIICSNYAVSKHFYVSILGLEIIAENYREARDSFKLDLKLPNGNQIELFSFPDRPKRPSYPEAQGLRHLAFYVSSVEDTVAYLAEHGVATEPVRIDEYTGKKYTFFSDPDDLPLELYEA
ncbi:VOC family protein [Marinomonas balearica]|uniref:Glyoxylase I family protein n=1 Tax=Marinomonas balearica TaxID=491947 RepID=A0A4R6MHD9_9GAMM|nr:VOC family protein [Marinomonas balearica]TDO99579.1 glyoxylase I family protein [Marinomonas balearica]